MTGLFGFTEEENSMDDYTAPMMEAKWAMEEREFQIRQRQEERKREIQQAIREEEFIRRGRACQDFIESEVGSLIMEMAARNANEAKEKLVSLRRRPLERKESYLSRVQELQFQARLPTLILDWLNIAIDNALVIMSTRDENNTTSTF
jgi:hypothetical protein